MTSGDWRPLLAAARQDLAGGRIVPGLLAIRAIVADPTAPVEPLRLAAGLLRSVKRPVEALPVLERVVALQPASAVAEHNLAAALGDMGDAAGAFAAAERAREKGGDAPETWLVRGRALMALGRLDEAEAALGAALARRPDYGEALRDMTQLIWMRDGDPARALQAYDARLDAAGTPELAAARASAVRDMLGDRVAYDGLGRWLALPHGPSLELAAAAAAAGFDPSLSLAHAEAAVRMAPGDAGTRIARCAALMTNGRTVEAIPDLDAHVAAMPFDQYALALRYTAWRLLDDPRALRAEDYARLVTTFDLVTPDGRDRETWLADTAAGLRALHPFRAEPLGQSIRAGVQAALDPRFTGDPAIDAVFTALEAPIAACRQAMAGRDDPMSRRAGLDCEIIGAWSVRLTAGGHHNDHVHPEGWVSSALYIVTPEPSKDAPHAGWLRFGAARLGVGLELEAEYRVEPRPGRVVLFPSWMWHGTEPFTGGGERLTIAFDVQPR